MTKKNIARAIIIAIIIGSLLNLINSYEVILGKEFTFRNTLKITLTYITPFCVSIYSSIKSSKQTN